MIPYDLCSTTGHHMMNSCCAGWGYVFPSVTAWAKKPYLKKKNPSHPHHHHSELEDAARASFLQRHYRNGL